MSSLQQLETVILLLIAVLALTTIARKLVIPYPILLVIGGLALVFIPGLPVIHLDPDLVFLVFLPPILSAAAYVTSWRDFRANLRPITLHAVGLVLVTTAAVAVVAYAALPGLGWAGAIALGAIVSPPDAVSATAIGKHLHLPHRVLSILEGESLVNDATALVLYRAAVTAVVSGAFVLSDTLLAFVLAGSMGIAIGLIVSFITRWILVLTKDSFSEIAVTLLAPYIAWVLAEQAHGSAVLACVAGGFYLRRHLSMVVAPSTRIQARAVWEFVVFLLNGVIFILIGLQLGTLRDAVPSGELDALILVGALVSVTAIVVRLLWVPIAAWVPRLVSPRLRAHDPMPLWSNLFIIGWAGMRGIVSLASAMAVPLTTAAGVPFPFRAEIILIAFMVILVTLVLQGLSLPLLIRALKVKEDQGRADEERQAREQAASAALARLEEMASENWPAPEQIERMRDHYRGRLRRSALRETIDAEWTPEAADAFRQLRHETLTAERLAAIKLRNDGVISDEVLHRLEHELDVEALRAGVGELRVSPGNRTRKN